MSTFPNHKTVLIAPLTPRTGLQPPPYLLNTHKVKLVSNFDIPDINKSKTRRRAEYSISGEATRHSRDTRKNRHHQECLYDFALFKCLGLHVGVSSRVLDLACGAFLPFGGRMLQEKSSHHQLFGLDQVVQHGGVAGYAQCALVGKRLPLRDSSIDYLVSISFLQWITAREDPKLLNLIATECLRVLTPRGGQTVFQFYPANTEDLNSVCEAFTNADARIRGCRISARPDESRGLKIYIYFVRM